LLDMDPNPHRFSKDFIQVAYLVISPGGNGSSSFKIILMLDDLSFLLLFLWVLMLIGSVIPDWMRVNMSLLILLNEVISTRRISGS